MDKNYRATLDKYDKFTSELRKYITPLVNNYYDQLTKTGHFSNKQFSTITNSYFSILNKKKINKSNKHTLIAVFLLIEQLLTKSISLDTYRIRQNRFSAFFHHLIASIQDIINEMAEKHEQPFYDWFTMKLLEKVNEPSAFETLTIAWLLRENNDTNLREIAKDLITNNHQAFPRKLASLLYLKANDGAMSLSILKSLQLHQSELYDHFSLMKQKQEWTMMKHWFELFFPKDKPKPGTSLGSLYEEMLIQTGANDEKLPLVWDQWLETPSFTTYKRKTKQTDRYERSKILAYILPNLKSHFFRPQAEATYYKILNFEQKYQEAIESLLIYKKDTNGITAEISELLFEIKKNQPELLLPFYHQIVERLVNKKTRFHYSEAISYIKELRSIYEMVEKKQLFRVYKKDLQQRYKTFRAFIQELNKLDL